MYSGHNNLESPLNSGMNDHSYYQYQKELKSYQSLLKQQEKELTRSNSNRIIQKIRGVLSKLKSNRNEETQDNNNNKNNGNNNNNNENTHLTEDFPLKEKPRISWPTVYYEGKRENISVETAFSEVLKKDTKFSNEISKLSDIEQKYIAFLWETSHITALRNILIPPSVLKQKSREPTNNVGLNDSCTSVQSLLSASSTLFGPMATSLGQGSECVTSPTNLVDEHHSPKHITFADPPIDSLQVVYNEDDDNDDNDDNGADFGENSADFSASGLSHTQKPKKYVFVASESSGSLCSCSDLLFSPKHAVSDEKLQSRIASPTNFFSSILKNSKLSSSSKNSPQNSPKNSPKNSPQNSPKNSPKKKCRKFPKKFYKKFSTK